MDIEATETRCAACNRPFKTRSQCPRQAYCARAECQCERRRRWQRAKRLTDPDYRYNQRNAQRAWAGRNSAYWRKYRVTHPQYCERNRQQQFARSCSRKGIILLSLASTHFAGAVPSGMYRIVRLRGRVAKMDLSDTMISWINVSIGLLRQPCKERTR
jgi:hypothetical protein